MATNRFSNTAIINLESAIAKQIELEGMLMEFALLEVLPPEERRNVIKAHAIAYGVHLFLINARASNEEETTQRPQDTDTGDS